MAYTPSTWVDETLASAELYNISNAGSAGSAIYSNVKIELSTPVSVAGTLFDTDKMTNIETGIYDLHRYGFSYGTSTRVISPPGSSLTLANTDLAVQIITPPGSSNFPVSFPAAGSENHHFTIINAGSGSANGALVTNDTETTNIDVGEVKMFFPGPTSYYPLTIGATSSGGGSDPLAACELA